MKIVWLAKLLMRWARWYTKDLEPNFEVIRNDKDVYLRRWWVIPRNSYFNIYLHNMLRDDDEILHDHMYASLSVCLGGRLLERYKENPEATRFHEPSLVHSRDVVQGTISIRSSIMAHQLIVVEPAWTIFITGPRIKEWGFFCPKGKRHWKDYVALSQDPSGANKGLSGKGVGCGEMD